VPPASTVKAVGAGREGRRQAKALYLRLRDKKKDRLISKGEFAHDVALLVQDGQPFTVPAYLREAITRAITEPGEPRAISPTQ
jgi:putative ATP-dependent endonuclease of OLD family